jgi:hypothetical protein
LGLGLQTNLRNKGEKEKKKKNPFEEFISEKSTEEIIAELKAAKKFRNRDDIKL